MNFNERLAELRKNKGLSRKECATELEVDPSKYNKWENGKNCPDYETIKVLAKYFNTTTDYLLGASDTFVKPEQVSAAPEAGKLIGAITGEVVPFFSSLDESGQAFSEMFSEYILDGVKDAVERCRQCYQVRDSFKANELDEHGNVVAADAVDLRLVELFLWPRQRKKLTQEELSQLYPRDKRILTKDPNGKSEWV